MTKVWIRDKEYWGTTAGFSTAYTLSIPLFWALEDLKSFNVKFHTTNGLNATLNINGLGAKPLVDQNNVALWVGAVDSNGVYIFAYNLTNDNLVFVNAQNGFITNNIMTTVWDMLYKDAVNVTNRLPIWADYQKLSVRSGIQDRTQLRLVSTSVNFGMSPFTISSSNDNEVFLVDTSGGAVVVNISWWSLTPWKVLTLKRSWANTVTINFSWLWNTLDWIAADPVILNTNFVSVTLYCSGANGGWGFDWHIIWFVGNGIIRSAWFDVTIS